MAKVDYIEDFQKWRSEFQYSIPVYIRFSETDMIGHMNNVSPFIYFEEARIKFLQSLGVFTGNVYEEGVPVVADLQCNYLKQSYFGETIDMYVKANNVGTTSIDFHYMAVNDKNEITLTGRGRLVFVDQESGKPVPLKEEIKRKLKNS
ncbi:thioesterase family protein [Virgibacillus sp. YIM 98842]|uniref:acyl-CoA thioesterase n=1 Tax=Virgibacillus sp. YIM 98842 TaxID=2663533 RepID=UPI0013DA7AAE|nr:thioesterase family protein [Virgibacillus sp. YIM 98842]